MIDPDYVPTDKDIEEYAAFLQLDLDKEPELAWIAQKVQTCSCTGSCSESFDPSLCFKHAPSANGLTFSVRSICCCTHHRDSLLHCRRDGSLVQRRAGNCTTSISTPVRAYGSIQAMNTTATWWTSSERRCVQAVNVLAVPEFGRVNDELCSRTE